MPYLDFDIDIEDFVYACSQSERKELFQILKEQLKEDQASEVAKSIQDETWDEDMRKLFQARHQLTVEEETIIRDIVNRII